MLVQTGFQGCWLFELTVLAFVPDLTFINLPRTQNTFHGCVPSDASGGAVGASRLRLPPLPGCWPCSFALAASFLFFAPVAPSANAGLAGRTPKLFHLLRFRIAIW